MGEGAQKNKPSPEGRSMASRSEYRNGWIAEKLDRVNLTMPKGKKDAIKAHAEAQGESVNGFINRAIDETVCFDKAIRDVSYFREIKMTIEDAIHELEKIIRNPADENVPVPKELLRYSYKALVILLDENKQMKQRLRELGDQTL